MAKKNDRCCFGYKYDLVVEEGIKGTCCSVKPKTLIWRVSLATLKLLTLICFIVFVVFPLVYRYSYSLQRSAVFLNFINVPPNPDYTHPDKYGLPNARNFYVVLEDDIRVGVWQILHENASQLSQDGADENWEAALADGRDVVLYNHGNGGSRLTGHRVELYKVLRRHFHVIAWDYRSFGDSTNAEPSEEVIVQDCIFMYNWAANRTKGNLFVWGHSLGTSLSTHFVALLAKQGIQPTGLILEAPFNNMREEVAEFPMARLFRNLPWFKYTVVEPMQENNFKFETDKHICHVDAPILILHALDDPVVPYKLGYKLYEKAQECRKDGQGKVTFHSFDASYKFGHKYICRAPDFHEKITAFISEGIQAKARRREDEVD